MVVKQQLQVTKTFCWYRLMVGQAAAASNQNILLIQSYGDQAAAASNQLGACMITCLYVMAHPATLTYAIKKVSHRKCIINHDL